MSIYANVGGAQKELSPIYNNISGAQHEMMSIDANINNASKNIYQITLSMQLEIIHQRMGEILFTLGKTILRYFILFSTTEN